MRFSILIFLLSLNIFASENYELKLYEKVIPLIFSLSSIDIYADGEAKQTIAKSKLLKLNNDCAKANLLISKRQKNITKECKELPYFATNYKSYKDSKNSIGVFYWRKGRPQLKLNKKNIQKFNLQLPKNLEKYAQ